MFSYVNVFRDLSRVLFKKEIVIAFCKVIFITNFRRDQLNFIKIILRMNSTNNTDEDFCNAVMKHFNVMNWLLIS